MIWQALETLPSSSASSGRLIRRKRRYPLHKRHERQGAGSACRFTELNPETSGEVLRQKRLPGGGLIMDNSETMDDNNPVGY